MKNERSHTILRKLFLSLYPVQAMAVGLPAINSLLNTFIIGPVLGEAALAVLGFATPLTQIITTISVLISIGAQLNCGRHLGEGDKEGIRRIFNTSLAACVLLGLPAALAFLLLSDKLAGLPIVFSVTVISVIYEDDSVFMVLRDDCPHFDPNEWLELCASDDPFRGIGIRMVSRLSKEMRYTNTLGLNVLTIRI